MWDGSPCPRSPHMKASITLTFRRGRVSHLTAGGTRPTTHVPGNLAVLCNLEALGAKFTQHF